MKKPLTDVRGSELAAIVFRAAGRADLRSYWGVLFSTRSVISSCWGPLDLKRQAHTPLGVKEAVDECSRTGELIGEGDSDIKRKQNAESSERFGRLPARTAGLYPLTTQGWRTCAAASPGRLGPI
jgi:hypothetical protein